jgi:hypothetical protein
VLGVPIGFDVNCVMRQKLRRIHEQKRPVLVRQTCNRAKVRK